MKSATALCWLYSLLLFLLIRPASGQDYSYTNYTTRDGLPSNTIHGLTQDKDGFMWFATENGLCRFDGTHFKTYTLADGLPSNEVLGVVADDDNRVWIMCFKSVLCYYKNDRIYTAQNDSMLRRLVFRSGLIIPLALSKDSLVFYSEDDCYLVHGRQVEDLTKIKHNAKTKRVLFHHIILGPPERLFPEMASIKGFRKNDSMQLQVDHVLCPHPKFQLFAQSNKPALWRLYIYIPGGKSYTMQVPELRAALPFNDSLVCLFGESKGMRLFNPLTRIYTPTFLPYTRVHSIYCDSEGNLWLTTPRNGIYCLNNGVYHLQPDDPKNIHNVFHIQKHKGHLYIGSSEGRFLEILRGNASREVKGTYALLPFNPQKKLIYTASSNFYKLFTLPVQGKYLNQDKQQIRGPSTLKSITLFGDSMLLSSSDGAALVSIANRKNRKVIYPTRSTCSFLYENTYFIGTLNGLYTIDKKGNRVYYGDREPLLNGRISYFAQSSDSMLWIATYEKGIVGFKHGKAQVHLSKEKSRLSANSVRCLYVDGHILWAGTDRGLDKIDIRPGHYAVIAHYGEKDGFDSDIVNAVLIDKDTIYVGTGLGLNRFREADIPRHAPCLIRLLAITVSGQKKEPGDSSLVLAPHDNNIRFDYAGISYRSARQMIYKYRLLGLSTSWGYTTETALNYPTLPAGRYVLQIRAINRFGDQSELLEQNFEVEQVLWKKNWFRILVLFLFLVVILLLTQWRITRIRKKEKEKRLIQKRLAELEHTALRSQMNPHFIFNCMSSIQHYILSHDAESANYYMTRFAALMRQTLDNAPKLYISLAEEMSYLGHYLELEQLQTDTAFGFSIVADPGIEPDRVMVPNMVIQPYVENAVKHGVSRLKENGRIEVSFRWSGEPGVLECRIEDNGPGIDHTLSRKSGNGHRSRGMHITTSRIDMLNQIQAGERKIRINVTDLGNEGRSGTRISIYFPF